MAESRSGARALLGQLMADPARLRAQIAAELARRSGSRSLEAFAKQSWHFFDPEPLTWGWHMTALCVHLEASARGELPRLIANLPPRCGKSSLFSIIWPAWVWTWWPQAKFLFLSHSRELAVEHSVKCRAVVESEWYQATFARPGGWRIREDQNAKHDFLNTTGGRRQSTSTEGKITGLGGDFVAIDDPLEAGDAQSAATIANTNLVVSQAISSRLNNPATGRVVVTMQRIRENDPTGYLLASGGAWEHLVLPSEFEPDRRAVTHRTVVKVNGHVEKVREEMWRDPREAPGEPLFPARFPEEALAQIRATMGEERYAGQHQQRPAPPEGNLFRRSDWRFWRRADVSGADAAAMVSVRPRGCTDEAAHEKPARCDEILISVDPSFQETEKGSFVAIHVWGKSGARRLLLDRVHRRMDFSDTVRALQEIIARWPEARKKVVEAKANGSAIMSTLEREHGISGLIPENPSSGNKTERASAMLPYHRAHNIELPDGAPWLGEYVEEHATFPNGRHDDDVDAQSQALRHLEQPETNAEMMRRIYAGGRAW